MVKTFFIAPLAKAAMAVGVSSLFMETHPEPKKALCDGINSMPLEEIEKLLATLKELMKCQSNNLFINMF